MPFSRWTDPDDPNHTAEHAANRTIRSPLFVVLVLLFIVLIATLYAVISLRSIANDIKTEQKPAAEARERILDLQTNINDCLQPTGKCAKRNQEGTANVSTAIIFCVKRDDVTTKDEVVQCVHDLLSP